MRLTALGAACTVVIGLVRAQAPPLPHEWFDENAGQYDSDILFGSPNGRFRLSGVELGRDLRLEFVDPNAGMTLTAERERGYPAHFYTGSDRSRWRENVVLFSALRYRQVYPGIDMEWLGDTGEPMVRIGVAVGADVGRLRFRVRTGLRLVVNTTAVGTVPGFFGLRAYQAVGSSNVPVTARFAREDDSVFRIEVGEWDRSAPLTIEIGQSGGRGATGAFRPHYDGSILYVYPDGCCTLFSHAALVKVSEYGQPVFVSIFDGVKETWLSVDRDGAATVRGRLSTRFAEAATTEGAPAVAPEEDEGWVARFDTAGRLMAATAVGEGVSDMGVDRDGAIYLAVTTSVVKWIPGRSAFSFKVPVRGVTSLSVNQSGLVAWVAPEAPGQATTHGALQSRYDGPEDFFAGTFETATGNIRTATYVPAIGRPTSPTDIRAKVYLSPLGGLWITSEFVPGLAHTLVAVEPGGRWSILSESVPARPLLSFDDQGNTLVLTSSFWRNLPTLPEATRRAACDGELHLRTITPEGKVVGATYLRDGGSVVVFEGLERLLAVVNGSLRQIDTSSPDKPGIACLVHTATRQRQTAIEAGGLTTIVGNGLGPLQEVVATVDSRGQTPTEIGGTQVLVNGAAVPLVSVQQGLVTFYLPEDTTGAALRIQVRSGGDIVAETETTRSPYDDDFGLLTADGSGQGQAAALNQDGTRNSRHDPAPSGTTVAIFGTGRRVLFYSAPGVGSVEYTGPAPGLPQGVKQINIRIAQNSFGLYGFLQLQRGSKPMVGIFVTQ